ncbi:hypothetical protein [Streptomyces longispororuber]|uniref:hypothetical protein n=1 Tax=Streptomyces longispororuber TaxID=68230 RepID=UPI0036F6E822
MTRVLSLYRRVSGSSAFWPGSRFPLYGGRVCPGRLNAFSMCSATASSGVPAFLLYGSAVVTAKLAAPFARFGR